MATDTDGRSASAPLAAPTTSAIPQGMHSTDDIGSTTDVRSGITFSTLPTAAGAAPSFFANPFMTPFMPQQPSSSVVAHQHQQQQTDHNEATAEYRINPLPSENYFLQSVHYQEMMQQYIQSLMAAASTLPPSSSIPADLHNQCFDGTIENVLSSATMQPLHDDHQQNESIPNKKVDEQQLNICHNGDYNDTLSLTTPQQQSSSANHSDSNKKQEDMSSSTSSSSSNIIDQNAHHQTECIANNHSNSINNPIETSTHLRSSIATQPLRENCTSSDARETIERREEILLETKVEANEVVSDKVDESRNDEENIDGRVEDADVEACSSGEVLKNVRDCGTDKDVTEPAVAADKCDEDLNEARNEMEQEEGRLLNTAHCLSVDKMGSLSLSAANKSLSKDEDTRCSVSNRNADEASKRQSQAQQLLQQQTASSLSQAHSDCGTSVLIKKQMNEIDKEINRRIQNKNIKKIDEKELAQLLSNANSDHCLVGSAHRTATSTFNPSVNEAALPFGISDPSVAVESSMRQKPTLNSSYCLSSSSSFPNQLQCNQQSIFHNHFPQQNQQHLSFHQQPPGSIPTAPPCFPTPYFPAFFSATANQQPTAVTPQLAAALLQQFQQQSQQMALFPLPAAAAAAAAAAAFQLNNNESTSSSKQSPPQRHDNQLHSNDNSTTTSHRSNNQQTILPPPHTNPNNTSSNHSFITLAPSQHSSSSKRAQPATTSESSSSSSVAVKSHTDHQPQKTTQHNWPDDSGWNEIEKRHNSATTTKRCETSDDSEPVWVMRDSYLKRMQREGRNNENLSEPQLSAEKIDNTRDETVDETDRLLTNNDHGDNEQRTKKASKKEVIVHEPAVLIEGVLFRARYLGSTQLICEGRPTKTSRMMQAQEAVARVKAPAGEIQPSTDIDLFISTEKIMVLNTDLQRISETDVRQDILMDHALRTISYIADIGDLVVLMARRMSQSASEEECSSESLEGTRRAPRVICHVFESEEASFIAQSIGQAFQVAYVEFLRANGIDDPSYLREIDYQEVLNSQEMMGEELEMFARKETQKDIVVPKKAGEPLGVVVVESGWGSMLPTVVIANLQPNGAASRCNQLNIGDQIIAINGISLVGLPLASAQQNIKAARSSTAVKLTVVSTPPVVEVRIKRPDTKYQLGFSVQNGVICSLLRGGIAERGGIRVGHRIIEINSQSVVAVAHEKIVNMLATAIGEIHMKTMPTSMFRLLTGQEVPNYI